MTKFYSTETRDAISAHLASLSPKKTDRHTMKDMVAQWSDHIARALTLGYSLSDVHAELLKHEADLCKFETFASYYRGLASATEEQKKVSKPPKTRTDRTPVPASPGAAPQTPRSPAGTSDNRVTPHASPAQAAAGAAMAGAAAASGRAFGEFPGASADRANPGTPQIGGAS